MSCFLLTVHRYLSRTRVTLGHQPVSHKTFVHSLGSCTESFVWAHTWVPLPYSRMKCTCAKCRVWCYHQFCHCPTEYHEHIIIHICTHIRTWDAEHCHFPIFIHINHRRYYYRFCGDCLWPRVYVVVFLILFVLVRSSACLDCAITILLLEHQYF